MNNAIRLAQRVAVLTATLLTAFTMLAPSAFAQTCPSPATEWTNPAGGNWGDAANWSNGVPSAGLNACIILDASYTVDLNVNGTAMSLVLGRSTGLNVQTLSMVNRNLTLGNPSTINVNGVLDWQSNQIGGGSTLTNDGLLAIGGSNIKDIAGNTTIRNQNLTSLSGTGNLRFLGGNSLFVNAASGTFDLQSDADFIIFNGGNAFDNDGLFQKTGGSDVSQVSQSSLDFDNAGTVEALSGTIRFGGDG
ncbi:MAG: hypothetical protein ABJF88_19170, partial [Rhodothermales bacterium]